MERDVILIDNRNRILDIIENIMTLPLVSNAVAPVAQTALWQITAGSWAGEASEEPVPNRVTSGGANRAVVD